MAQGHSVIYSQWFILGFSFKADTLQIGCCPSACRFLPLWPEPWAQSSARLQALACSCALLSPGILLPACVECLPVDMSAKHFLSGIQERNLHGYSGIVLNKFTGLCNLAIPCHLYYAILTTILSSFLVFLIKSFVSFLMYKIQFVRLHNVLKQNTGADCSDHNLLISSLSKSLYSLPPLASYSHQVASLSICWGLGWSCYVWFSITHTVSPKLDPDIILTCFICSDHALFVWICVQDWSRFEIGFSCFCTGSLFDFLSFFSPL